MDLTIPARAVAFPAAHLMVVLALLVPAHAAETLSLERALALADESNPRLRAAAAQTEGARAGIRTARAYPNPDLDAAAGRQRSRSSFMAPEGSVTALGLNQPIDLPSVRDPRIRAAEAGLAGSQYALAELRLAVRATVKQAYYEVLRRKAEFEVATETQQLLEDIRRRVQVRVDVGEAPRLELTRAEAEASVAANTAASARLRVTQAIAALRAAIGAPLPPDVEVVGDLATVPALPDVARLRDEVLANYPALAQSRAEAKRAEARLATERALRIPQPTVRAGFEQEPDTSKWVLGIGIPIPVWDQRQGQIGEAVAAFQEANANVERRRVELLAAFDDAYGRFQVATQSLAAYESAILRQAEAALRVAEAAYRFGERGFIEVLDAQRVLRSARFEALAARFDQRAALIEIEQLRALDYQEKK
jgi:cobalt-zinc-cadmium efflux system outer membrane protein